MFSAFNTFGKLGALASSVARAWSPLDLWPDGIDSPGMWIDPSLLSASFNDYTGTTPVATPGSVADSANPVGLALDIRAGATAVTDPGNHMLQATSAARPLLSARVNLFDGPTSNLATMYPALGGTLSTGSVLAPDGVAMSLFTEDVSTGDHYMSGPTVTFTTGQRRTFTWFVKANGRNFVRIYSSALNNLVTFFNLTTGASSNTSGGTSPVMSFEAYTNGIIRISVDDVATTSGSAGSPLINLATNASTVSYAGDGVSGVYVYGAQMARAAAPYQRVNSTSDYDASAGPTYLKFDGVDDGMATAAFSAGTLINGMDCMIPVRRDSGANAVCGLYESVAEANKVFGIAESGSSSGCVGSGAGTPTVWVDNVQLTGDTAVTRGTLHTALTTGAWHILEFRGLDLSTWTASGFGLYTSYKLPGARGDIMLYPSTASTADKNAARQYLADKYGVTLP